MRRTPDGRILVIALALLCISGAYRHPLYRSTAWGYFQRELRAGFEKDSWGWEEAAYFIRVRVLGFAPRDDWPPVPHLYDLFTARVLRPVYPFLGALALSLWPEDEVFRAISIAAYMMAVLLIYGIARTLGRSRVESIIASAIFAVGTLPLRASNVAMADSSGAAASLLAVWFYLRLRGRLSEIPSILLLAGVFLFALLTNPMALALIPAFVLVERGDRARFRAVVRSSVAGLLAYGGFCLLVRYSPFHFWLIAKQITEGMGHADRSMPQGEFYALALGRTISDLGRLFLWPYTLIIALAAVGMWRSFRDGTILAPLALGWLGGVLLLLFTWGLKFAGIYFDRVFIYAIPPLCLPACDGLRYLQGRFTRIPWRAGWPLLPAALVIGISPHFHRGLVIAPRPWEAWAILAALVALAFFLGTPSDVGGSPDRCEAPAADLGGR